MRILYDGYIHYLQKAGGVNRYFSEIISGLPSSDKPCIYAIKKPEIHVPQHRNLSILSRPPFARFLKHQINWYSSTFDIFHPTYYHLTDPFDWGKIKIPVVLTVYDFIFFKYRARYERSAKLILEQERAIRRADLILCISHSTQKDLLELFPDISCRIAVTHLASNTAFYQKNYSYKGRPYFLYVGARVFYKNFILAVEAIKRINEKKHKVDLIVAGGKWTNDENDFLLKSDSKHFIKLIEYPSDDILTSLYQNAVALLYPSEYEGFGLPPLEAMTQGTPVVALNTSSLPEVVGLGGILLDPTTVTVDSYAAAVEELLTSPSKIKSLSEAAIQQAKKFSWKQTVAQTRSEYNAILK